MDVIKFLREVIYVAVNEDDEIMIINTEGIIIRMFCSGISVLGRITSGVKLINLNENDTVLIVDDFLAKGNALLGLIDIVNQAGGTLAGCSIAIEKGYQGGGDKLRNQGIRVESMAIIDEMDDKTGKIVFRSTENGKRPD